MLTNVKIFNKEHFVISYINKHGHLPQPTECNNYQPINHFYTEHLICSHNESFMLFSILHSICKKYPPLNQQKKAPGGHHYEHYLLFLLK